MKASEEPIVVENSYACSLARLWDALTDPKRMVQWYFEEIPDFKAEPGFHVEFVSSSDTQSFTHIWTVTDVEAPNKICYKWHYAEYPGKALTCFELSGDSEQCSLRVTMSVAEDFPDEVPEFARESGVAGWNYFLKQALPLYFEQTQ